MFRFDFVALTPITVVPSGLREGFPMDFLVLTSQASLCRCDAAVNFVALRLHTTALQNRPYVANAGLGVNVSDEGFAAHACPIR